MPIRTHRGRAAVYRRLWGWPLRSPRHLVGTLVVFVALVVATGIAAPHLFGDQDGNGGAGAAPAGESTTASGDGPGRSTRTGPEESSTLPTRLTEPRETPTPAAPDPAALQVARQWAAAWVNHPDGMTNQQWLDGLRPYTTEEYLPVMATVELANIPASEVTGEPSAGKSYTSSVEAIVPTNGPKLKLTVVETDAGWRVGHYERAD
ncbi:hypothetical protein [Amycolatopsis cihanbeyliensis]|uniref:Uncharacterized protein n=1 Tax=Amycolatopsis cihanbeyliensis TaxID=1128664 RepID=A0A542DPC2_AMYCI|nr:hypothetical protein [Amycolatopsis cihanbeyliensis]TQJ04952.1 hypothetical protein FB471_4764 [Amycolatopsis cihanbeyliensis]